MSLLSFRLPLEPQQPPAGLSDVWQLPGGAELVSFEEQAGYVAVFYVTAAETDDRRTLWCQRFRRDEELWVADAGQTGTGFNASVSESELRELLTVFAADQRPPAVRPRAAGYVPLSERGYHPAPPLSDPSFKNIVRVTKQLRPIPMADIAAAQAQLPAKLPPGVAEYLATFGACDLSILVRVYPPERLVSEQVPWRKRVEEYFFWEKSHALLDHQSVLECVVFASTMNGDQLLVHPHDPGGVYVLPRHADVIHRIEGNFESTLRWIFTSGELVAPTPLWYAETWGGKYTSWVVEEVTEERFDALLRQVGALPHAHVSRSMTDEGDSATVVLDEGEIVLHLTYDFDAVAASATQYAETLPPRSIALMQLLENAGFMAT